MKRQSPIPSQPYKKLTKHQTCILLASFQSNPCLDQAEKERLAKLLDISEKKVQYWFYHTRSRKGNVRETKRFTEDQRKILIEKFHDNPYITREEAEQLAQSTNISEGKLRAWFARVRFTQRKKSLCKSLTKGKQQILAVFKSNCYNICLIKFACKLAKCWLIY